MQVELKQGVPRRAATGRRRAVRIPVVIAAKDKSGADFREDSQTIVVTGNGLMVVTTHQLAVGTEILIANPSLGLESRGRVIWCGSEPAADGSSEIGVFLPDAERLCGLQENAFPEHEEPPRPANNGRPEEGAAPSQERTAGANHAIAPESAVGRPPQENDPGIPEAALEEAPNNLSHVELEPGPVSITQAEQPAEFSESSSIAETAGVGPSTSGETQAEESCWDLELPREEESALASQALEDPFAPEVPETPVLRAAESAERPLVACCEAQTEEERLRHLAGEAAQLLAQLQERTDALWSRVEEADREIRTRSSEVAKAVCEDARQQLAQDLEGLRDAIIADAREKAAQQAAAALESLVSYQLPMRLEQQLSSALEALRRQLAASIEQVGQEQLGVFRNQAGEEIGRSAEQEVARIRDAAQAVFQELADRLASQAASAVSLLNQSEEKVVTELEARSRSRASELAALAQSTEEKTAALLTERVQKACATLEQLQGAMEQQVESAARRAAEASAQAVLAIDHQSREAEQRIAATLEGIEKRWEAIRAETEGSSLNALVRIEQAIEAGRQSLAQQATAVEDSVQISMDAARAVEARLAEAQASLASAVELAERNRQILEQSEQRALAACQSAETQVRTAIGNLEQRVAAAQASLVEATQRILEEADSRTCKLEASLTASAERVETRAAAILAEAELQLQSAASAVQTQLDAALGDLRREAEALRLSVAESQRQAAAALESQYHQFEQRMEKAMAACQAQSDSVIQQLRRNLEAQSQDLMMSFMERFQEMAGLLEECTREAIQNKMQTIAQELAEASAAELRRRASADLDEISRQFGANQARLMSEGANAFRQAMDELMDGCARRLQKLAEENLECAAAQWAARQKEIVDRAGAAFRAKIAEMLARLQEPEDAPPGAAAG
jgi:hypothetical protein